MLQVGTGSLGVVRRIPQNTVVLSYHGAGWGASLFPQPCLGLDAAHVRAAAAGFLTLREPKKKVTTRGCHCFVEQQEKILPGALKR